MTALTAIVKTVKEIVIKKLSEAAVVCGLALCLSSLAHTPRVEASETSQIRNEVRGPGFDPTPVQIPPAMLGPRRSISSMDLLTIRDLKGVQISPDGKSVAFVLS